MSVKTRLKTLNERLADELCTRFVSASADETTTALMAKLATAPRFLGKGTDLRPRRMYTTYPAYTAGDGTVTDPGIAGTWNDDESVTLTSLVDGMAWPNAICSFESTPSVNVGNARLCVDAQHTSEFNMNVRYKSPDGKYHDANLSDMAGIDTTDFARGRTSLIVNFGAYIIEQGHTNPPTVHNKFDLLALATGQSSNYFFDGGQVSFGKNGDSANYLMKGTINLNDTPYLYYSVSQDDTSGCTFGLYCENPWYMFRDGSDNSAPTMNTNADNYTGPQVWMFGKQTGCVDLREYVDSSEWSAFNVRELKFYGYDPNESANDTAATFNYLFVGSAPVSDAEGAWGDPATPTHPLLNHSAVGGNVTIQQIHYYVIGAKDEYVKINQATFVTEHLDA